MTAPQFAVVECERPKKQHHWCSFAEFLPDSKAVVGFIRCQLDQPFLIALWDAESGKKLKVVDNIPYSPTSDVWISPDRRLMAITTSVSG
jgi:WD40 repeat protein